MAATRLTTSTTTVAGNYFIIGGQGASLASADSIAVTDSFHQVTGSTEVNSITGGTAGMGLFLYRATGATWALGSSGNIKASATTFTERTMLLVTPDGTTWYGMALAQSVVASANTDISVAESNGTYTLTFNPANVDISEFAGIPVDIADGGTGQTAKAAAFDALAPTTTRGDLIQMGASDNERLAVGAANTVIKSDGTDASWTASPVATTWGVGDANNGMVSIASNNIGWKINSTNELDLDATRLAPVTDVGLDLGDANQNYKRGFIKETCGVYTRVVTDQATESNEIFATMPVADNETVAFNIIACMETLDATEQSSGVATYQVIATAKATTITINSAVLAPGILADTTSGTLDMSAFTLSFADAGSNVLNLRYSKTIGTGTATSANMRWSVNWTTEPKAITEVA